MKLKRTSKTTLKFLTSKKRQKLHEVMDEYSKLVNYFIDLFWESEYQLKDLNKEITSKPESWLSPRMRQCASREALSAVNGAKQAEQNKPHHNGKKITLSSQCIEIQESNTVEFDLWLMIFAIGDGGKIFIPVRKHRQMNWYKDWTRCSSVTIHRNYVQFTFKTDTEPKRSEGELIGIDVGINHLLATSEGELLGSETKQLINKIKSKQQGSNAHKRAKKELKYYLHKVVKDFFVAHPNLRLVVCEKLHNLKKGKSKNRSKEFRKTLSNWNYRVLLDVVKSHTETSRVSYRSVNPYKTSQLCPSCARTERGNRVNELFKCLSCGHSGPADLIASLNILTRFLTGRYGACFLPSPEAMET